MLPVIDIFAGPGGLGEGFAQAGFDIRLSVEMDPVACQTLRLRKFFNQFPEGEAPKEYYDFLKGDLSVDELEKSFPLEWERASEAVANLELGAEKDDVELHNRLQKALNYNEEFILIGGPPCQAYSLVGRSRMLGVGKEKSQAVDTEALESKLASDFYEDKRHTLYLEYLKILYRYQPAVFVMENVKGLSSAKAGKDASPGSVFSNICYGLRHGLPNAPMPSQSGKTIKGYRLYSMVAPQNETISTNRSKTSNDYLIKSENYGIPQSRHRIIIVGIREDIKKSPQTLIPSKMPLTVKDAIIDLPKLRSGLSKEQDSAELWASIIASQVTEHLIGHTSFDSEIKEIFSLFNSKNTLLNRGEAFIGKSRNVKERDLSSLVELLQDRKIEGYIQHETRAHMRSDLLRYFLVSAYGKIFKKSPKIDDWEGRLNALKPNHSNIGAEGQNLFTSTHKDRFKVQVWGKPSSTVVSHISKDGHYFIHPDPTQCRSLTVREAARLQTFSDNYFFCGNRTQQYHQVGNAVPVLLAKQIAEAIAQTFN